MWWRNTDIACLIQKAAMAFRASTTTESTFIIRMNWCPSEHLGSAGPPRSMPDGPRRSRFFGSSNIVPELNNDLGSHGRKGSNSNGTSAAVFSLALFQEKYAESLAYVSTAEFRFWWIASVLLHASCAVFLVQVGRLYLFLPTKPVMWFFELYSVAINTSYFGPIAVSYFCTAAVHAVMLTVILMHSIHQRRPAFRAISVPTKTLTTPFPSTPNVNPVQDMPSQYCPWIAQQVAYCASRLWPMVHPYCLKLWEFIAAIRESFDIRSKHYGATWVAMEMAQTLLQSYQAMRLSALVPRLWMTNVVVALIVLNCWSLSIVTRFFSSEATHARLYGLALSLMLDLVSYIVVPVIVFLPYKSHYNPVVGDFGDAYWYNDVWLVRMINELQLLFVVSFLDGASKAMMALSVPRSLFVLTKLLRERPASVSATSVQMLARSKRRRATIVPDGERGITRHQRRRPTSSSSHPPPLITTNVDGSICVETSPSYPSPTKKLPRSLSTRTLFQPLAALNSSIVEHWGHRFLQIWGIAILGVHLHATTKAHPQNCTLHAYPWFVTKPTCSLLEINCNSTMELSITGGAAFAIDSVLEGVDAARVQHVVFRHCEALELPPRLANLPHLVGLKIRDSTIVHWNESAALTQARHPELRFLFMGNVNMSAIPEGLLSHDFPERLRDIEMCRVNLTRLPDQLDRVWPANMFLLLEEFQFQEFPEVVLRLRANLLSLAYNGFTSVPRALFAMPHTETLILNGNPLEKLPRGTTIQSASDSEQVDVGDSGTTFPSDSIAALHLVATPIDDLPRRWSDTSGFLSRAAVNAARTPLCNELLAMKDSQEALTLYSGMSTGMGIDCFDDARLTWYPIFWV